MQEAVNEIAEVEEMVVEENPFRQYNLAAETLDFTKNKGFARDFRKLYEGTEDQWGLSDAEMANLLQDAARVSIEERCYQKQVAEEERCVAESALKEVDTDRCRENARLDADHIFKTQQVFPVHSVRYIRTRCEIALNGSTAKSKKMYKQKSEKAPANRRTNTRFLWPAKMFTIKRLEHEFRSTSINPENREFAEVFKRAYEGETAPDGTSLHDPLSMEQLGYYPIVKSGKKVGRGRVGQVKLECEVTLYGATKESLKKREAFIKNKETPEYKWLCAELNYQTKLVVDKGQINSQLTQLRMAPHLKPKKSFLKPEKETISEKQLRDYAKTKVPGSWVHEKRLPSGYTEHEIAAMHPEISQGSISYRYWRLAVQHMLDSGEVTPEMVEKVKGWRKSGVRKLTGTAKKQYDWFSERVRQVLETDLKMARPRKRTAFASEEMLAKHWFIYKESDSEIADQYEVTQPYVTNLRMKFGISQPKHIVHENKERREMEKSGTTGDAQDSEIERLKANALRKNLSEYKAVTGKDYVPTKEDEKELVARDRQDIIDDVLVPLQRAVGL